jgi:CsoR family transcriptional regulator, copper-sensing transcriptional repressor
MAPARKIPKTAPADSGCDPAVLHDESARSEILNRLRRAEGQLRGIQRMIEDGEDCLKIGQQFAAVRKALDSTYLRMTVCFMEQELQSRLAPAKSRRPNSRP